MTSKRSRWGTFAICWVLLALMAALWSLATPIAASPDEPDHFVKAASVVLGQFLPPATPDGSVVTVPRYVAFTHSQTCFAFQDNVTADCSPSPTGDSAALVVSTTTAGLYNPVYYLIVGWPSLLFHSEAGLYAMRIVSGVVGSLFLALAFVQLLELRRRRIAVLAFAVAATPMVFFLMASVNPNSLETTATLCVFVTSYLIMRHPEVRPSAGRMAILLSSATIGVMMRGLSPLWVAIALLSPLLLLGATRFRGLLRQRRIRISIVAIGVVAALAIVWILASNSLGAGTGNAAPAGTPGVGESPLRGFALVLFDTFSYNQGLVGDFGWLDTPAPLGVFFAWSVFVGVLVLLVVVLTRSRQRILSVVLLACVVLLPPVLQGIYIHSGGIIWQGRYILPVFVCLVVAMGLALSDVVELAPAPARLLVLAVMAAWVLAQADSFASAIQRYAVGVSGGIGELVLHPAWSPPGGVVPLIATFTVVALATAALLAAASWPSRTGGAPASVRRLDDVDVLGGAG